MTHILSKIEKLYPNWYDEASDLPYSDQVFIWENVPLPEEDEHKLKEMSANGTLLKGSVNGSSKRQENFRENLSKHQAIARLKTCNYRTPPKETALYLETIFGLWKEKPLHWIFIAQFYTPKAINSVINEMRKRKERGGLPINNPGGYFTKILRKFHPPRRNPKRKEFTDTSGSRKHKNP